jgi:hypothetical protein
VPLAMMENVPLAAMVINAADEAFLEDGQQAERIGWFFESGLDPNDWRLVESNATGIRYVPLTTRDRA